MSKRRLSSPIRQTRSPKTEQSLLDAVPFKNDKVVVLGLALGGGKTDRAALAVIEYYPKTKKVVLANLIDELKSGSQLTADDQIYGMITQYQKQTLLLALDTPWRWPLCLTCRLNCPGVSLCDQEHIQWMWRHYEKMNVKKKPKKFFTSYTQRCFDLYAATELEQDFHLNSPMGANNAPLLARARFLLRRLNKIQVFETANRLTLARLGKHLLLNKNHFITTRRSAGGDESRLLYLEKLAASEKVFFYEEDKRAMIERNHSFEAFISGLTGLFSHLGWTEKRPEGFPLKETWPLFIKNNLPW